MGEICRCVIPEICPNCRYLYSTQVIRIRRALKENPDVKIHFKAFNKLEADEIKKLLTFEELKWIFFSYYIFKGINHV